MRAPDFWGTALRMAMITDCVSHTESVNYGLVLANIHSILDYMYDVPRTVDVGLPTKSRSNVGPASQPIAGSMLINRLRRWPNTDPSLGLLYTLHTHVSFTQCCFNVDPQSSTLARH